MVDPAPDVRVIERMLAFFGHTIGAGCCWPDLLTRETTVEHNRQHLELQAGWPREKVDWPVGKPVELPADAEGEEYRRNHLFMVTFTGGKINRQRLPEGAWLLSRAERLDDGTLRLRHRIDRKKLPPERAYVMWSWRLTEEAAKSPVTVKGAAGPWVWHKTDSPAITSMNGSRPRSFASAGPSSDRMALCCSENCPTARRSSTRRFSDKCATASLRISAKTR